MTPYQFEVWKRKMDNDKRYRELANKAYDLWMRTEPACCMMIEQMADILGVTNIDIFRRYFYTVEHREFVKRFKPSAASVISVCASDIIACYDRMRIGTLELENQTVEVVYESSPPITPESDHFHGFTSSE